MRARFLQAGDFGPIGEENIHAAIIVVIQDCDTAAHKFHLVKLAGRGVLQFKSQPRFLGDLFKPNARSFGRSSGNKAKSKRDLEFETRYDLAGSRGWDGSSDTVR